MTNTPDGSSPERAIPVASVGEEYKWLATNCGEFTLLWQSQSDVDGKPYDVLMVRVATGEERRIYFDISSFFGKPKEEGPPCPHCGQPLRTARAKQCRHCHADWH